MNGVLPSQGKGAVVLVILTYCTHNCAWKDVMLIEFVQKKVQILVLVNVELQ